MNKIVYTLWDARYLTDPDRAICFDTCENIREVRSVMSDYGDDTVIVKETLNRTGAAMFEVIKSEIIKP